MCPHVYSTQSIGRSRQTEHSAAEALSTGISKDPFVDADDVAASSCRRQSEETIGIVLPFKATFGASSPNRNGFSIACLSLLGTVTLPDSGTAGGVDTALTACAISLLSTGKAGATLLANRSATALLQQPIGDISLCF